MNWIIAIIISMPVSGKGTKPFVSNYSGIKVKSGMDNFGYLYQSTQDGDNVSFHWIDIAQTGTALSLGDDDSASVSLPFAFGLYEDTATAVLVQSNGGITFRNIRLSFSNHALPDTNGTMIATYWSDLDPSSHGNVYYQSFVDSFVIEWYQVPEYSGSLYNTFEAVIYNNNKIKLQYLDINEYSDETIGIQSGSAYSSGNGWYLQYVYSGNPQAHVPADSSAVLYYYVPPQDHDAGVLNASCTPDVIAMQDSAFVSALVKNFGLNSESFNVHFVFDTSGTIISDSVYPVTLNSADTTTVSFIYHPSFAADFHVTTFTDLATDTNYINDTTHTSLSVITNMPLPYNTDFESDSGYFYHSGANDPWQWGVSAYAHSGTHAWATSLQSDYPNNADGTLYSYPVDLSPFSTADSTSLSFYYFDSLETNYDYVYLMITPDDGATWDTVRTYNGYETGWNQDNIDLKPYNGHVIKFAFAISSDASVQKAGFYLDDLSIHIPLNNDVGILSVTPRPSVINPGDTSIIEVVVHNFGLLQESNFYAHYYVSKSGSTVQQDSALVGALNPSSDTVINWPLVLNDTGAYDIFAWTTLGTDEYNGNDTCHNVLTVGTPDIVMQGTSIGGDGIADVGENNVPLIINIVNAGARADSTNITLSTNSQDITIHTPQTHFIGEMACGDTVLDTFYIDVSPTATQGETVTFNVLISTTNGFTGNDNFDISIGGKTWTIMVLVNGDNNLTSYGVGDVDEMETAGSDNNVNILVQFDGETSYSDSAGSHTDANRYYLHHVTTPNNMIDAYPLVNLGEVDMGDTNVIFDFFKWGVDNYPAKHYMFIIWDHGSGWVKGKKGSRGVSHDDTNNDYLSFANGEYRALVRKMHDYIGRNLDIMGFDVCLVQMVENLFESQGYVDHVVASEKSEPGDGWDYHFISALEQDPNMPVSELARQVVDYYATFYNNQSTGDVTLSSWDLNRNMHNLFNYTDLLARELILAGGISQTQINNVVSGLDGEVESSYDPYKYFVDIKHFAMQIKAANINSNVNAACDSITDLFNAGMITDTAWASSDVSSSMYGISIMLPPAGEDLAGWEGPYTGLRLSKLTLWDEFLNGATSLPASADVRYYNAYFIQSTQSIDTLYNGTSGEMHIILKNFTAAGANNVYVKFAPPSYITLSSDSLYVGSIPADTTVEFVLPYAVSQSAPAAGNEIGIVVTGDGFNNNDNIPIYTSGISRINEQSKNVRIIKDYFTVFPSISRSNSVNVRFAINNSGMVCINLFDIQGRRISTLLNKKLSKGVYNFSLSTANSLHQGVYFVELSSPSYKKVSKIVFVK